MKKIIMPFLVGLLLFASCKKEGNNTPDRLIGKEKMVDIMYDLSLFGAIRSQNPTLLDSFKDTPNEYIYKKYKIDSAQFTRSNIYYATDLKEYEKMFKEVELRLSKNKAIIEALIKTQEKKALSLKKEKGMSPKEDSIKNAKLKAVRMLDSIRRHRRGTTILGM